MGDGLHRLLQLEFGLAERLTRRTDEPDIPGFEGLGRFPELIVGGRADDRHELPVVVLGLPDHRPGRPPRPDRPGWRGPFALG